MAWTWDIYCVNHGFNRLWRWFWKSVGWDFFRNTYGVAHIKSRNYEWSMISWLCYSVNNYSVCSIRFRFVYWQWPTSSYETYKFGVDKSSQDSNAVASAFIRLQFNWTRVGPYPYTYLLSNPLASKLREASNALREERRVMDEEFIRSLILSMPRRVKVVRRARGRSIKYWLENCDGKYFVFFLFY